MSVSCKSVTNPHHLLQKSATPNPKIRTKPFNTDGRITRRLFFLSLPASTTTFLLANTTTGITNSCIALADLLTPSDPVSQRVSEAVELLEKGRELQALGDFKQALRYFTLVVENYKDFALSDYARVGRALALYEVGDREESIAEMEDVSISLKGYPEVHAALAAALYADKHAPILAENQFTIATVLDPHYTDLSYVKDTKHWPPSLISRQSPKNIASGSKSKR